jgi:chromosomal replication initiation ATPase DnaA
MIVRVHCIPPIRNVPPQPTVVERIPLRRSLTPEQRDEIARLAALIPDRINDKQHIKQKAADEAQELIASVLARCQIGRRKFFQQRRRAQNVAVAGGIAVLLRERDEKLYSYPFLASLLHRKDHTTIMHGVRRWPEFAVKFPDVAAVIDAVRKECKQ